MHGRKFVQTMPIPVHRFPSLSCKLCVAYAIRGQDNGYNYHISCIKPLQKQRQNQKHLKWAEVEKRLDFRKSKSQSLKEEWRDDLSSKVKCPVVSDDLGCHVICWC
ncbi:hypothetical protein GOODEAATRI_001920 [Goodea atripinnis]|uniref:Uncharacterized protein n=1 Tax=Goodea atripinnis TaxID=208336 RepID=A0ABV0PAN1_9TELE